MPIETVRSATDLLQRIPRELVALAENGVPWTSYVAYTPELTPVGVCAFKNAPDPKCEVEIAYFTFPEYEGRGYGSGMGRALLEIAAESGEVRRVIAQTLREESASVRICRRLGFVLVDEVLDPEDGPVWRWSWQTGLANSPCDAGERAEAPRRYIGPDHPFSS